MLQTKRIAVDGALASVYFALSFLVITSGNLQIRFTSLSLIIAAFLYTAWDACLIALLGEFLYQLLLFGLSPTTPIWLLPPVLHALLLGLCAAWLRKRDLTNRGLYYLICICCGVCNSVLNTLALYADSKLMGYYQYEMIFSLALVRILIAVISACVLTTVAIPLIIILKRTERT